MVFWVMGRSAENVEEKKKTYVGKLQKFQNMEKLTERKTKNTRKVK